MTTRPIPNLTFHILSENRSIALLTMVSLLSVSFVPSIFADDTASPGAAMTKAANRFVKTLSEDEIKTTIFDYDSPKRVGWHFIPKDSRKGFQWKKMSKSQKVAAMNLLQSSLSAAGYTKARNVMQLESFLYSVEQGKGNVRDPERYYFTLFGKPGSDAKWGFSFEGHHLSMNFVVKNDKLISVSPSFYAANPATVKSDRLQSVPKGTRVLASEEKLAFFLVNDLSETQKSKAIFAKKAPKEIRAAGEPQAPNEKPIGIKGSDLNKKQLAILKGLVVTYAANFPIKIGTAKITQIEKDGWGNVHFAWGGATKPGIGHYYRIQGENVLIEFVNTQPDAEGNPANHIHCVWRNPKGDFAIEIEK